MTCPKCYKGMTLITVSDSVEKRCEWWDCLSCGYGELKEINKKVRMFGVIEVDSDIELGGKK